jgi:hypothetical protein
MALIFLPTAIVAHKGTAVDDGHYTTFVRKATFSKSPLAAEAIEGWYKFDDDTVLDLGVNLPDLRGGGRVHILIFNLQLSHSSEPQEKNQRRISCCIKVGQLSK